MSIRRGLGMLLLLSALGCKSNEELADEAFDRGNAAQDQNDYDKAIAEYTESIRLDPDASGAYVARGISYADKGEFTKAIADYTEAIRLSPDDPDAYSNFAWMLATCRDDTIRDGTKAVELATRACELSKWKDGNDIENLAASYAECGQFEQAVNWQTKAIDAGVDVDQIKDSLKRLELFKTGKPYRE
jgi:tetratricopeptide (TPR) repeat protein